METSPESHVLCVNDLVGCLARECDSSLTCLLYLHVVCSGKKNLHGAMKCRRQVRPGLPAQTLHRPSLNDELICGRTQQKGHQKADQPRSLCTRVLKTLTDPHRPPPRPPRRAHRSAGENGVCSNRLNHSVTSFSTDPNHFTPNVSNSPSVQRSKKLGPESRVGSTVRPSRGVPRAVSLALVPRPRARVMWRLER